MKTIDAANVSEESLKKLDGIAEGVPEADLRAAIHEVSENVRSGRNVVVAADAERVTPAMAAKILGVSRTHLYKVMDADELPWTPVGRDRRIALDDIRSYVVAQDEVRKAAAERFAHPASVRQTALDRYKQKKR